jgi:hypothetical protein
VKEEGTVSRGIVHVLLMKIHIHGMIGQIWRNWIGGKIQVTETVLEVRMLK